MAYAALRQRGFETAIMAAADYELCGWRVASTIPLPELAAWQGESRAADIMIATGKIPAMDEPRQSVPGVCIDKAGNVQFCMNGIADYHLGRDGRILIAPADGADPDEIRLFLWTRGLPYLMHQRGIVPIQASCVTIDGAAVLIAGRASAGKSTLADGFARRGFPVVSDNLTALDLASGTCLPLLPHIALWADTLAHGGQVAALLRRCRKALPRYWRPLAPHGRGEPSRPIALLHLNLSDDVTEPVIAPVLGRERIAELTVRMMAWGSLRTMAGSAEAMRRLMTTATAIPRHATLKTPVGLDRIDATIDAIVAGSAAQGVAG